VAVARDRVHATAIAIPDGAVLIRGPSGSGKSDLALRCLALSDTPLCPHPVRLVADDQVLLERRDGLIHATAPQSLQGLLEVRGLGIVSFPASQPAVIRLVVDLAPASAIERLPESAQVELLGVGLPHLLIAPFEHSAPLKVLLALARQTRAEG
jgi:HPr kinase/phosphorylase